MTMPSAGLVISEAQQLSKFDVPEPLHPVHRRWYRLPGYFPPATEFPMSSKSHSRITRDRRTCTLAPALLLPARAEVDAWARICS